MDRLEQLLDEWETRRDRGDPVTPEALCRDDPALAAALAARVRRLEQFDRLFRPDDSVARPALVPRSPARIGRYEVQWVLGQGGMGVVYLARDPTLGRLVAVKTIRPEHLTLAPETTATRFAREGRVLAALMHPHIVAVFEGGSHDGGPYLAMEYVPGGNLAEGRERVRRAGPAAVAALFEKVARAVHFAHAQPTPVLHRDLKPSNILLTDDGEPKIADFGLAKLLTAAADPDEVSTTADTEEACKLTTAGGRRAGTPGYMAPEQADPARGPITPATDVWGLGVSLHELLTGERPTLGASPSPAAVARAVPGRRGRRLAAVVSRCLRESYRERYQTAEEVADALGRIVRPRRRGAVWAVLAAVLVVLTAGPVRQVNWTEWQYERSAAALRGQVAQGEAARVIGPGVPGRPAYRVREGEAATTIRATDDNGLRVQSNADCTLVELLALPPGADVTVRAVLRLDRVFNNNNKWGVYCNHHSTTGGGRTAQFVEVAGFTDPAERQGAAVVALVPWLYAAPPPASDEPVIDREGFFHPNAGGFTDAAAAIREVVVRVRADTSAWLGPLGNPHVGLGPLAPPHRLNYGRFLAAEYGVRFGLPPDQPVRIGLCARHCCVTVLDFRVFPNSPFQE